MEELRESIAQLNRQLERERQRRTLVEAILSNIHVVLGANDVQQAFEQLVEATQPIIPFDMVGIMQPCVDDATQWECVLATDALLTQLKWSAGALFERVLQGTPVASFDVSLIAEWRGALEGYDTSRIVSVLHSPIEGFGRRAMMICTSPARAAFGRQHIESAQMLSSLASQVLINMEHRRTIRDRDVAQRADQAKSMFLAAMSHELRTPLNIIIGYCELIAEEAEDREVEWFSEDLDKVLSSAQHLLGLIGDVLDISRVEQGKMDVNIESFSLEGLLRVLDTAASGLMHTHGNTFSLVPHEPLPTHVDGDQMKIRQVLLNLLGNAAKFTEKGTIALHVKVIDQRLRFEVHDTGQGINADDLGRLFDAFERVEQGFAQKEGAGLGLALSRRLATLLGGDLWCESTPGEGSVFFFEVPI